jgi:hypothetical protein
MITKERHRGGVPSPASFRDAFIGQRRYLSNEGVNGLPPLAGLLTEEDK